MDQMFLFVNLESGGMFLGIWDWLGQFTTQIERILTWVSGAWPGPEGERADDKYLPTTILLVVVGVELRLY
jgi:hypothetical protein